MGLDTHMGLGLPVPGTSSSKRNLNRPQPRDVSRAALAEAVDGGASGFFPPGHPPHPPRSLTAAVSSWNPLASDNRFILEMKIGWPEPRRVWWRSFSFSPSRASSTVSDCIYSFSKHLLSAYYMPGAEPVRGEGDSEKCSNCF